MELTTMLLKLHELSKEIGEILSVATSTQIPNHKKNDISK